MANEITVQQLYEFLPVIFDATLTLMQRDTFMTNLVRTFTDLSGWNERQQAGVRRNSGVKYVEELEDLLPTAYDMDLLARIIPRELAMQYVITDRRIESDPSNIIADAAQALSIYMSEAVDTALLGTVNSFTGGTIGAAGADLTFANIYQARARLEAAGVRGRYALVLHPLQWLKFAMTSNISTVNATNQGAATPLQFRNDIQSQYYVQTLAPDIDIYVTNNLVVDGNDDVVGGLFNRDALAFDLRRPLRIEPQRDASLRLWELNATMAVGTGGWYLQNGVRLIGDAALPGTNVTTNTDIALFGNVESATAAIGATRYFDVVAVNNSNVMTSQIVVTLTIPAGFGTFVSYESLHGVFTSNNKKWNVGSLAPGQTARLRVRYTATANGAANFSAALTSSVPVDNVAGNNATGNLLITVS